MKTILTIALTVFLSAMLNAQSKISENQAEKVAIEFVDHHLGAKGMAVSLTQTLGGRASQDNVYIFDIGSQGYVMVSGNTVLPPVLAYSMEGTMPSLEDAPENVSSWFQHYSDMIDFAVENGIAPEPKIQQQWDDAFAGVFVKKYRTTVEPLIATQWNQDCYYNEYCPATDGGWWGGGPCGHVYAGCVACAMAQVMKYWNHPEVGYGSHSYNHSTYGQQSANFGETTYHWDDMPVQIYSHNDAVATLMYHCGVSVDMNYSPSGSGAQSSSVETAMRSYFGYCGAKHREKSKYEDEVWESMLRSELDLSHPVYYSGTAGGSSGHAFVCDGYDNLGLFHFNFGWSGSADNYYSLYDVNGYNQSQEAVMNIYPMDIRSDENGIIYVTPDGEGNGSSWSEATHYLEFASYLSSGDNRVWVKKGVYYGDATDPENAFNISASNKIYGGFNGDEGPDFNLADRDLVNHASILDGQGSKRVLKQDPILNAGNQALWDGFVIENGYSGAGGGAYLNGYATLSNCIIRNNVSQTFGGGVYINTSNGVNQIYLNNCEITGNQASMGGGICTRTSPVLTNCLISNNTASTKGGGLYIYNSAAPVLKGCVISNNTAVQAGGAYVRGESQFHNCNILMNKATEAYGGTYNEHSRTKYYSCILWGNEANGTPNQNEGSCTFDYCAVQGGIDGHDNFDLPAENDGEEPGFFVRFLQPASGAGADYVDANWDIQSRSICLNAGKPGAPNLPLDIAGRTRFQHGRVDIGAYECNASLTQIDGTLSPGETYLFNGRILTEWGYYTTVYPMADCDSVVGLSLQDPWDVKSINEDAQVLSVEVYSLLGQYMGTSRDLNSLRELRLTSGCYLLRMHTTEGVLTKKVILR